MQKSKMNWVVKQYGLGQQCQRWFLVSCMTGAIGLLCIAHPAIAEGKQVSQTIHSDSSSQVFSELMQQAQAQARSLIEQAFADPTTNSVSVKIMGERNGQEAPLLFTNVSRTDWQRDPRLDRWTKYFTGPSAVLLGYLQPKTAPTSDVSDPVAPGNRGNSIPGLSIPPQSVQPEVVPIQPRGIEDDPGFRDD